MKLTGAYDANLTGAYDHESDDHDGNVADGEMIVSLIGSEGKKIITLLED